MPTEVILHGAERSEPRTRVAIHDSPPSATHQRTTVHGGEGQVVEYADALRTRVVIHQSEADQVLHRATHDPLHTRVQLEQRSGPGSKVALMAAPEPQDILSPDEVLQKLMVQQQMAEGELKAAQAAIRDLDHAIRETRLAIQKRDRPRSLPSSEPVVIDAATDEQSEPNSPQQPSDSAAERLSSRAAARAEPAATQDAETGS